MYFGPKSCQNQKRIKSSSVCNNKAFCSIPFKILPHFDENNISVAQKLTKWYNFKEFNRNLSVENLSKVIN